MKTIQEQKEATIAPPAGEDLKRIIDGIDLDSRMIYVYGGLMVHDAMDMYILDLEEECKNIGMIHGKPWQLTRWMRERMNMYKATMYSPIMMDPKTRNALVESLGTLDDEFGLLIKQLRMSIRQYLLDRGYPDPYIGCISIAAVINILAQYSILNDVKIREIVQRQAGKRVHMGDEHAILIERYASKFMYYVSRINKKIDINLNDAERIKEAVMAIDKKCEKIPEIIKSIKYE